MYLMLLNELFNEFKGEGGGKKWLRGGRHDSNRFDGSPGITGLYLI